MRVAIIATLLLAPGLVFAASVQSSAPNAVFEGEATVADGPIELYGTADLSLMSLPAWVAQPIDSGVTFEYQNNDGGQGISHTGGHNWFKIPIVLPTGVLVSELEFNYCDTGADTLIAIWFRQPKNDDPVETTLLVSEGTPGCVVQTVTLTPPRTIWNKNNSYNIELIMPSTDGSLAFNSLRVGYKRQVSPAPATATFGDVPTTHSQFRFVEALVDAGITGGCGGGDFCPDNPLTRGQMAVFLSTALGLHYAN
jgi:hypothetical protein